MIPVGVGAVAGWLVDRRVAGRGFEAFVLTLFVLWWPRVALPAIAGLELLRRARALHLARCERRSADQEILLLSQSVGIGLRAGLTPIAALKRARALLTSELSSEVDRLLRHGALVGAGPALSGADGRARILYHMIGRAIQTGAPLATAVDAATTEIVRDRLAARLASIRRLPVRLMVPLTLCILPGFVLMTLGPVIDEAVKQFSL